MPDPAFSVVMAVRNGAAHIARSLDSILGQTVPDFECIVVDDGSTDGTPDILASFASRDRRVRVLRNETSIGPYGCANRAMAAATGRFIARHDGDDISPPDRFAVQLAALRSGPDVTLVTGAIETFSDSGEAPAISHPPAWQPWLEWELLFRNAVGAGAHVMFPRVVDGEPVLFPARHRYAEDYGLWCTLARRGRVVTPRQVVYRYRRHAGSITAVHAAEQARCAAEIRNAYQALYLDAAPPVERSEAAARFWSLEGEPMRREPLHDALHLVLRLRAAFVPYVSARYGQAAGAQVRSQIDRTLDDRFARWAIKAIAQRDWDGCRALTAAPGIRARLPVVVARMLHRYATAAGRRR